MSLITTTSEALKNSSRRILVCGPRASGKTLFSMSASRCAGERIDGVAVKCEDVLLIQGDNEGVMGALDAGLEPAHVLDMTMCDGWRADAGVRVPYIDRLREGLREVMPKIQDGTIKVIVVDLNLPARLIDKSISPEQQRDWKHVALAGNELFGFFSWVKGVTVIGNAQIKAAQGMANEAPVTANAATAKAIGGERSTFTVDLPKGIFTPWADNCSFIFVREAKRVRGQDGAPTRTYKTHTQSGQKFEAKSRAGSKLLPVEDGEITMRALLARAYGESI